MNSFVIILTDFRQLNKLIFSFLLLFIKIDNLKKIPRFYQEIKQLCSDIY